MPTAQQHASRLYREGLAQRGVTRFEVMGLHHDKVLIRELARKLVQAGPDADRLRSEVARAMGGEAPARGGVLDALRRSPLGELDLSPERSVDDDRRLTL